MGLGNKREETKMLRIPAPTAKDRVDQWTSAYDAAEALFAKAFKDCPQLICNVTEASVGIVCEAIAARQNIPSPIIGAAVATAANDLHEQYHNRV